MHRFVVSVIDDDTELPAKEYVVMASTDDDAIQLAFALDGGWSSKLRNATGMLGVARSYCRVVPEVS